MTLSTFARLSCGLSCVGIAGLAIALCNIQSGIAAVVGETTATEIAKPSQVTTKQMRAAFVRPTSIPFPASNPYTAAKVELGKKLYFDTRLSGPNLLSCAACHNPGFGWGDAQPLAVGHGMNLLPRRSPTIINLAYGQLFMWDSRIDTLEAQVLVPIRAEKIMHLPLEDMVVRLSAIADYQSLFAAAFPNEPISASNVGKAIATYERTVVSGWAPFDAWIDGDERAISKAAQRGFEIFNTKGKCSECHSGWNFTDDSSHDIGLASPDIGRGKILPDVEKMQFAFKTPGLREIAQRGPYMHDGSIPTLEAVVEHYDKGGISRPSRSDVIVPLGLTVEEKADLVSFLKTLTSEPEPAVVPLLPR